LPPAKKSDNKADVINQAQKLAAKGMLDKAIAEWQKLLSKTQNDGNIYNTIGDLHLKANHTSDALVAYLKAADVFKTAGFELKSAAIYKKVIKIDPARLDVHEKLADLHADRGLTGNAAEDYLRVAKQYAQRGDHGATLSVYQKLSRLDPKNCDIRIKIAETCRKLGLDQQAVEAYDAVRSLYEERNMAGQARAILDQILKIDPQFLPAQETPEPWIASEVLMAADEAEALSSDNLVSAPVPEVSLVAEISDGDVAPADDANPSIPLTTLPAEVAIDPVAESTPVLEAEPEPESVLEPEPEPEPEPPKLSVSDRMESFLAAGDWAAGQALLDDFSDRPIDRFNYLTRWVDALLARQSRSDAYYALKSAIALSEEYASFSSELQDLMVRYLEADPDHLSAYPILAGHLEKAGNNAEAAGVYSKLISLLQERGNDPEAQEYYETLKARFPDTIEFQEWQAVFEPAPPPIDPLESTAPLLMTTAYPMDDPAGDVVEDLPLVMEALPPVADETIIDDRVVSEKAAEITLAPPPPPSQKTYALSEATLKSYLTEAEVYIKYKLYAKAIEHLEMVAGLAPGCIESHAQLKDLYVTHGDLEKAAVQHLILAQLYDEGGMVDQKEAVLASLDALDPEGIYHHENGASDQPDTLDVEADDIGMGVDLPQEAVVAQDADVVDLVVEDVEVLMPDLDISPEIPTAAQAQSTANSNPFIDRVSAGFSASILEHMQDGQSGAAFDLPDTATNDEEPVDAAPAESPETSTETFLEDSLNTTIKKMKDAGRLTPKYLRTRYDLGVAYQEMGLLQDAIKEFDLVIEAGFRLGEAYVMIARCHQANDAFELAEHLLHEGVKDARCTPEERQQLQYEIEALHPGVGTDASQVAAEVSVPKMGEDDPSPCDAEVSGETEAAAVDSQPSIPAKSGAKSGARKKRIAYL